MPAIGSNGRNFVKPKPKPKSSGKRPETAGNPNVSRPKPAPRPATPRPAARDLPHGAAGHQTISHPKPAAKPKPTPKPKPVPKSQRSKPPKGGFTHQEGVNAPAAPNRKPGPKVRLTHEATKAYDKLPLASRRALVSHIEAKPMSLRTDGERAVLVHHGKRMRRQADFKKTTHGYTPSELKAKYGYTPTVQRQNRGRGQLDYDNQLKPGTLQPAHPLTATERKRLTHVAEQRSEAGIGGAIDRQLKRGVLGTLELTGRTSHIVVGSVDAAEGVVSGRKSVKAAAKQVGDNITGKEHTSGSDLLKHVGVHNKIARAIGGFATDVALDPLTYATLGTSTIARKAGEEAARAALRNGATHAEADAARDVAIRAAVKKHGGTAAHAKKYEAGVRVNRIGVKRGKGKFPVAPKSTTHKKTILVRKGRPAPGREGTHVVARTVQSVGKKFAPDFRPQGVDAHELEVGRHASRRLRAANETNLRKAEAKRQAIGKQLPTEEARKRATAAREGAPKDGSIPKTKAGKELTAREAAKRKAKKARRVVRTHEKRARFEAGRVSVVEPQENAKVLHETLKRVDEARARTAAKNPRPEGEVRKDIRDIEHKLGSIKPGTKLYEQTAKQAETLYTELGDARKILTGDKTPETITGTNAAERRAHQVATDYRRALGAHKAASMEYSAARKNYRNVTGEDPATGQAVRKVVGTNGKITSAKLRAKAEQRFETAREKLDYAKEELAHQKARLVRVREEHASRGARGTGEATARRNSGAGSSQLATHGRRTVSQVKRSSKAETNLSAAKAEARDAEAAVKKTPRTSQTHERVHRVLGKDGTPGKRYADVRDSLPKQKAPDQTVHEFLKADNAAMAEKEVNAGLLDAETVAQRADTYMHHEHPEKIAGRLSGKEVRKAAKKAQWELRRVRAAHAAARGAERTRLATREKELEGEILDLHDILHGAIPHTPRGRAATFVRGRKVELSAREANTFERRDGKTRDLFEEDAAKIQGHRTLAHGAKLARQHWADQVKDMGIPWTERHVPTGKAVYQHTPGDRLVKMDEREVEKVLAGAPMPKNAVLLHERTTDHLLRQVERLSPAGRHRIIGMWKTAYTILSPAYHVGNEVGNRVLAWMADVSAESWNEGRRMMRLLRQAHEWERSPEALKVVDGRPARFEDTLTSAADKKLYAEALKAEGEGAATTGIHQEIRNLSGKTARKYSARRFSERREMHARLAVWHQARKEGLSVEHASDRVNKFLIDYGDLTAFEEGVRNAGIPFYTFWSRNSRNQVEQLFRRPGKAAAYEKAREDSAEAQDQDPNFARHLQHYQQMGAPFILMHNGHGILFYGKTPIEQGLAFPADLANAVHDPKTVVRDLISRIGPQKLPVEWALGYDSFRRKPIVDYAIGGNAGLAPAPSWIKDAPKAVQQLVGYKRAADGTAMWRADMDYFADQAGPYVKPVLDATTPKSSKNRFQESPTQSVLATFGVKTGGYDPKQLQTSALFDRYSKLTQQERVFQRLGTTRAKDGSYAKGYAKVLAELRAVKAELDRRDPKQKQAATGGMKLPTSGLNTGGAGLKLPTAGLKLK